MFALEGDVRETAARVIWMHVYLMCVYICPDDYLTALYEPAPSLTVDFKMDVFCRPARRASQRMGKATFGRLRFRCDWVTDSNL